jgi:hypothetical protein
MDKAYQSDIPAYRKTLQALQREYSRILPATDWARLRIEPLLEHVAALDRRLRAREFPRERTRLRRGVRMFRSDLVYLRANIKALKAILAGEQRRGTKNQSSRPDRPLKPASLRRRRARA